MNLKTLIQGRKGVIDQGNFVKCKYFISAISASFQNWNFAQVLHSKVRLLATVGLSSFFTAIATVTAKIRTLEETMENDIKVG